MFYLSTRFGLKYLYNLHTFRSELQFRIYALYLYVNRFYKSAWDEKWIHYMYIASYSTAISVKADR